MTLRLPYDGIGGPLPPKDDSRFEAELARRLEGIQGNFLELAAVHRPLTTRRIDVPVEEATSSTSYTTLATADQVDNVWVERGGFIGVGYQALWKHSASAAHAAIFIGDNQLKVRASGGGFAAPVTSAGRQNGTAANTYSPLVSCPVGLAGVENTVDCTSDVTTGQAVGALVASGSAISAAVIVNNEATVFSIPDAGGGLVTSDYVGGECLVFVEPGSYTISVRFKTLTGTVTVKDRKLWAWTRGA